MDHPHTLKVMWRVNHLKAKSLLCNLPWEDRLVQLVCSLSILQFIDEGVYIVLSWLLIHLALQVAQPAIMLPYLSRLREEIFFFLNPLPRVLIVQVHVIGELSIGKLGLTCHLLRQALTTTLLG